MTIRPTSSRRRSRSAFTLMEVLIVVAIIVILAGVGAYYVLPQFEKSKEGVAKTGAHRVATALQQFYVDNDSYPSTLADLTVKSANGGPYCSPDDLLDPWGKEYQIDISGQNNGGAKPDVFTQSPDGKMIGNWGKK